MRRSTASVFLSRPGRKLLAILQERAMPLRIAVKIKLHNNPIDDEPRIRLTGQCLSLLLTALLILLLNWKSYRLMLVICILSLVALFSWKSLELLNSLVETWRKRNPFVAFFLTVLCLSLLCVCAPFLLCWKASLHFDRAVEARRERESKRLHVSDSTFASRLTCHGVPDELVRVLEINDVPFEPIIVRGSYASGILRIAVVFAILGMACAIPALIGWLLRGMPSINLVLRGVPACAVLVPFLVIASAVWIERLTYPLYYRIVPGRLDVLKYNAWGTRPRSVERFDLRCAVVTVDFSSGFIRISAPPNPPAGCFISLEHIRERHQLAQAILMAAMSSYPAAPVSDKDLLA